MSTVQGQTTAHADLRARKRIGVSDVSKLFQEALTNGTRRQELRGTFSRYMDKQAITHRSNFVIYKNVVFWFGKDNVLKTVIPLHQKWHKYIKPKPIIPASSTTEGGV
ncbi:hypothetical protein AHiyo8_58860 [Arthrobacter sp. Hiyo8]|uniref:hypothetical protein n=1 Tax=Arthrobacter sp. Hiyo1 TaxID=1588020 RepID=UPI0006839DE1|nr:hypothetical protein [Arthrobacter sp. Hiyo1]BAS17583.1 hypothetical protein AHiyo8_58860 [Arthrobacter sp. Hiyo8]GAP57942.1 hypothetical protein AHiyo1_09040 [Arthrobacter sp. Hiyo1]